MNDTDIRKYADLMRELDLTGLEITENDRVVRLERAPAVSTLPRETVAVAAAPAEAVPAPVEIGAQLGTLTVTSGAETLAESPILAGEEVPRVTYGQMLLRLWKLAFLSD